MIPKICPEIAQIQKCQLNCLPGVELDVRGKDKVGGGGLARNVPRHVDGVQDGLELLVARLVAAAPTGTVRHVVGQLPLSHDGCALRWDGSRKLKGYHTRDYLNMCSGRG